MDPLKFLEMIKQKREEEQHNLLMLLVHMLLTEKCDGKFEVSRREIQEYFTKGDRDLNFESCADGTVRLVAVTHKTETSRMSADEAEDMAVKARALADAFLSVLGDPNHGKH